ncbi:MAG: alpha/beta hydrolase [Hydrogenophaga sp.]|jgi:pimeloyl-ACP methyl ester carboxylesterase|uniref:alpha/beta fold hydrolase n=1 Tax=Hydrogenophaga sp. TaxID=1904254 RepID=UPI00271F024E|nr:alpha/beta hydrolase [Hydrogenophaga sp.]MDO9568596.1 alpha/beta hydrolase [Hydrogenophaga sp.]MDP3375276.1 alpha/beta hydrolase [Hydrogenophaga sp.]
MNTTTPGTYVLVHGTWHTGAELEAAASHLRAVGHTVHCPTLAGNRPGDDRACTGLEDAAQSLKTYIEEHNLNQVRLVGHSDGGMVISRVADLLPQRIARLVYVNAFVPQPGERLNDLVPPHYVALFNSIATQTGGGVMLPFPVWREALINDADLALATRAFEQLNVHPYKTFQDQIVLSQPMAAMAVPKSYVNCRMDTALPHSLGWHPRLSERLGLFRYAECSGNHEVWFTDPEAIAAAIERAGRD